ncbi:hypothetical protein ABB34_09325 [Stenotrophomonas daejeonensis]|uniref:Cupin type-2 domain-containing protein n=1 Tax=Stenotrophomonas daejeonensis TaxID=659018 RepID=A0A0R0E2I2_9GAMM|nr:hypothetical protein ABB34_09325 [Stenotrophomonas daejeonensis]
MRPPIFHVPDLDVSPLPTPYAPTGPAAVHYAPRLAQLGGPQGVTGLATNLIALAPGMRAFPFHSHRNNDELFYVITGAGELRYGAEAWPIREGDLIACPAGGPETAHQIRNTGTVELRYLAIGTNVSPDIVEYPDTGQYKAHAHGVPPFDIVAHRERTADYWAVPHE